MLSRIIGRDLCNHIAQRGSQRGWATYLRYLYYLSRVIAARIYFIQSWSDQAPMASFVRIARVKIVYVIAEVSARS
jgi:hypothetical protein